jgi:hypothetical protein
MRGMTISSNESEITIYGTVLTPTDKCRYSFIYRCRCLQKFPLHMGNVNFNFRASIQVNSIYAIQATQLPYNLQPSVVHIGLYVK